MSDQVTDWFDKRYKPRYNGLYQVTTKHWPWPLFLEYNLETGWSDNNFVKWRGIKNGMA